MTKRFRILNRSGYLAGLALMALTITAAGSLPAQVRQGRDGACWQRPAPETLEEAFIVSGKNSRGRQAQAERRRPSNALLLISNGGLKVAYGAGLIVGWGETGERPRFAAITAVGSSAMIAPFAFIGSGEDQAIADIFTCQSDNPDEMAERAASFLDEGVITAIASEHDAGRRLFVALPGSATRPETVWDIGALAKSQEAGALPLVRDILRASVTLYKAVEPGDALNAFRQIVPKNPSFRHSGTGQEFPLPTQLVPVADGDSAYFFIHNDRLFWDESADYIASRKASPARDGQVPALLPGYDIVRQAVAARGSFHFATPKTAGGLVPQGEFDHVYLKNLFHHAFRQARMGKEWAREFPGLRLGAPRP